MSPVQMRKLELHVLKSDIDEVLDLLGESGCFQLASPRNTAEQKKSVPKAEAGEDEKPYARSLDMLRELRDRLDLAAPEIIGKGTRLPGPDEERRVAELAASVEEFAEAERHNSERRAQAKEALEEAKSFAGMALPFRELDHLSFLAVRIGKVGPEELSALKASLGDRALVLPIDDAGGIVAAAAKKGRYALDTELARAKFRARELPPDFAGLPPELPEALEKELAALEIEADSLARKKTSLKTSVGPAWTSLAASYAVAQAIEEVKAGLDASDFVYRLEGWVPRDQVKPLSAELQRRTGGRVALRIYVPEELASVRSGEESVPVLLKRRAFVSSFEPLVVSYGAPLYGTVDPTPFVAFFFVLLFSIMFGDLGQGLVIVLVGLLLRSGSVKPLVKWKKFSPILVAAGIGSMVMGFLDGTFFANEKILEPVTRSLSSFLFGNPVDRFISLMPQGGMQKLFAFFGFTLSVGVIMNSTGLVVNIVNQLKRGHLADALFSKTGLAGALFFWWCIGLGLRSATGGSPAWFDIAGIGLPLAAIFFEEPLGRLVEGKEPEEKGEGAFSFVVKGLVELIESFSYYFSNTLSFLRVGAFALSHAVLSFIVFTMSELLRERAPAGVLWQILILIIGNAIILVLEGMIVVIQVVRLQYYEFFSKFFTETGKLFDPFRFVYRKE